jgi:hypothetical protein
MIDVGRDLERIRDYVAGRLPAAEQRAFEERLAHDPDLVRQLELSERLREGLERLRDSGELDRAMRGATRRHWAWGVGLAATVAGVALTLFMQPGTLRGRVPLSSTAPPAGAAARLTFVTMRGKPEAPVLELPARGVVELRASRPAAASGARYRLTLERIGTGALRSGVGELGGLEPGSDSLVHAYVDADALAAGEYELRVQAEGDPGAGAERFGFSLRSAPR